MGMSKDIHNNISVRRAISPVSGGANDTASVSQVCDRQGYEAVELVIATGSLADADATFTVLIEESDSSGSGFSAVADEHLLGTEAGASFQFDDDDEVRRIGYTGSKRYLRATITPASNTGAWLHAAVWVLSGGRTLNTDQTA